MTTSSRIAAAPASMTHHRVAKSAVICTAQTRSTESAMASIMISNREFLTIMSR